jgi:hypothetical protein
MDCCPMFTTCDLLDCYMAVTGVPNPQADHALRMAKFARECIHQMKVVTKALEVRLG